MKTEVEIGETLPGAWSHLEPPGDGRAKDGFFFRAFVERGGGRPW